MTGRINRDVREQHGSTYRAVEQPDFLWCEDPWFRPVDIKLAPDGSMYIADFYNCIIGHYEVDLYHPRRDRERGRLWRVVYTGDKGKPHKSPGDLSKSSAKELITLLGHSNIIVRTQATHEVVQRIGASAKDALAAALVKPANEWQATHAAWALERLAGLSDARLNELAGDPSAQIRLTAAKIISRRPTDSTKPESYNAAIGRLLSDADPFVRRAAADAAGLRPHSSLVAPLLAAWSAAATDDTHLIHTIRMALRDQLVALTEPAQVAALREQFRAGGENSQRLAGVSLGARSAGGADLLMTYLSADASKLSPEFASHMARYIEAGSLPRVYEMALAARQGTNDGRQTALLRSMQQASQERGTALPAEFGGWANDLVGRLFTKKDEASRRSALELVRDFKLQNSVEQASELARSANQPMPLRQLALEVVTNLNAMKALPLLSGFVSDGTVPVANRQRGIELLAGLNSADSRAELTRLWGLIPDAVALAAARALSANRDGSLALLTAVEGGKTSARLLQDIVVTARVRSLQQPELEERRIKLTADLPDETEQSRKLIGARSASFGKAEKDLMRGGEVFAKTCAACHRAEGKGTKVGPDLDGIGLRGVERLLEDVLVPSRNVDQAFRSTLVALRDGKTASGLLLREEGEVVVLVNDQGKEVRIPKAEIEERRLVNLSPMPANIAEQLPEGDFHNLIGYLLSLRQTTGEKPR